MLNLLYDCTRPGYPPDYLLARIQGRLGMRVSGGKSAAGESSTFQADDSVIWDAAAMERRWLYLQMDIELRKLLAPLLVYLELNALILWLRSLGADQSDAMAVSLENSLLTAELKKIILVLATPVEVVVKVERFMANSVLGLNGLALAYKDGGVQKCEELIWRRFFERVLESCGHPIVIGFFRTIIDMKNTVILAKYLRWKKQDVPVFFKGGHLRLRKGGQVLSKAYLENMVQRLTGGRNVIAADLSPVNLEQLLYGNLAQKMARQVRSDSPVGCCIAYIWLCFAVAKMRSGEYHRARFTKNFPESGAGEQ